LDLSGFTNYTAEHGDDAAGTILIGFRATCRQVSSARGVRIAKWLGDGCMLVSVHQPASIAAVLDIADRSRVVCAPLALRAGLATGHALLFEGDDYIGAAVNLAARLCDAAGRHEVLMAASGLGTLPPGVTASAYGPVLLHGFPEPVDVIALSGMAPDLPPDEPTALLTGTDITG